MDPRMKKNSNQKVESDIPSPVLLRRRLSAPETVMRKYKLERARSQESDTEGGCFQKFEDLSYNSHCGSEINLQKKKDTAVMMRKSTLLRRLMNNPKTFGSSSFQEWQHYCGKLSTPSLNSLQGSPEHMSKSYSRRSLIGYEYKTSPKHVLGSKKVSPVHQLHETHRKSPVPLVSSSPKRRTENHGYQVQTMKPKESSSYKYSGNENFRSKTIDQSDRSNLTPVSSNIHQTTRESIILRHSLANMDQRNVDENRNFAVDTTINNVTQETSTQTASATNLNVISNVKLSQKTLDLIVSEVMKDVQQSCVNGNEIPGASGGSIHVQKISGMNTKPINKNEKPNDLLKCLNDISQRAEEKSSRISVISTISSIGDKSETIEDQSDAASLADSLEDTSSSRLSFKKYDDKPVRGDLPPIPLRGRKKLMNVKPPDSFFVPIKTDLEETKSVSDYMPEKLKDKISRRQKTRQEKLNQHGDTNPETRPQNVVKNKTRFRKPLLPSIEIFRKKKESDKEWKQEDRNVPKKTKTKYKNNPDTYRKSKLMRNRNDFDVFTSENDYFYNGGPKRIYHKAEFRNNNRRIEILEIMECVDISKESESPTNKIKSKIPVLRKPKSLSPLLVKKTALLDFNEVFKADPSLDQLITDILIQSLNNRDAVGTKTSSRNEKDVKEELIENSPNKEKTNESGVQVSEHELNEEYSETKQVPDTRINESNHNEVPTITRDSKNTQTWGDFQQPQRKEELSDHTSNEGRNPLIETRNRKLGVDGQDFSNDEWRRWRRMNGVYEMESNDFNDNNNFYEKASLPPQMARRYAQTSRRARYKNTTNGNPTPGEWSIILSGMNNATTASDLEMKIRFPSSRRSSNSHFNNDLVLGGIKDRNESYSGTNRFPHNNHRSFNNFNDNPFYNESNGRFRKLPGINCRDQDNRRVSDPVAAFRAMEISDFRPKQTKTSLRRYNMTRPKLHPLFESSVDSSNIDSQYSGMLSRVPELLSINGYSVNQDYKHIPGMRRNIPRHNCLSNGM